MTLHMLSFRPDFGRLVRLAQRERLLPPGDDLGYAVHAVLAACFGSLAPKPFALMLPGEAGGGSGGRLLAYAAAGLDALRGHAGTFADPAFAAVLALDEAEAKVMPDHFSAGTRLGFRVRLRPTVRTGKPQESGGTGGRARERDVFLAGAEGGAPEARAELYAAWLAGRLAAGGARLERATLDSFRLTRLMARDRSPESTRPRAVSGPDAAFTGTLVVTDPEAFAAGLARGVGRHRAFGFGMLLLTPPVG